jgi:DNA-binding NtrC family response regulator
MVKMLAAWIGRTDLRAPRESTEVGDGPIAQAVATLVFDELLLLSNYPQSEVEEYLEWLRSRTVAQIMLSHEPLSSPTDFGEIYQAAVRALKGTTSAHPDPVGFTFHLSPGTPAMAAVWILLAKTSFPAELIESSREHGVRAANVPFEIAADFIPDLLRRHDERLRELSAGDSPVDPAFEDIIHRSEAMGRIVLRARRVAVRNVPVLLEGESGTGKEMLARAIHRASPRRHGPFMAVNCGAIPPDLIEAELFGAEKGAFTGATQSRIGYFEAANTGTLFLDELGELPPQAQVKLLRVLQEGDVTRLGATSPISLDVRVLCATNRTMTEEVAAGRFREDLFYRLAVAVIRIPPLRERPDDLILLVERMLDQVQQNLAGEPEAAHKKLSSAATRLLVAHPWPGNVRELLNTLQRVVLWSDGSVITEGAVQEALLPVQSTEPDILGRPLGPGFSLPAVLEEIARHYLSRAMEQAAGNKSKAAQLVGLPSYQTLTNWLAKYNLKEWHGS